MLQRGEGLDLAFVVNVFGRFSHRNSSGKDGEKRGGRKYNNAFRKGSGLRVQVSGAAGGRIWIPS